MKRIITFLLLLILISCELAQNQSKTTTVYGQTLERETNKPIPNSLVVLNYITSNQGSATEHFLDSVRSDPKGNYSITVETSQDLLELYAEANGYFNSELNTGYDLSFRVNHGKESKVNVTMLPHAWVVITCENALGNDRMYINRPGGSEVYNGFEVHDDTIIRSRCIGNNDNGVHYFIYKNNSRIFNGEKTFQSGSHDTSHITISF